LDIASDFISTILGGESHSVVWHVLPRTILRVVIFLMDFLSDLTPVEKVTKLSE
jgi:hypothetical protein